MGKLLQCFFAVEPPYMEDEYTSSVSFFGSKVAKYYLRNEKTLRLQSEKTGKTTTKNRKKREKAGKHTKKHWKTDKSVVKSRNVFSLVGA